MFKINSLTERVAAFAESPSSSWWLALMAFLESWIFPIPPDVLIIALLTTAGVEAPRAHLWRRAVWYALITTLASVAGGIFAYLLGSLFFASVGQTIVELYHLESAINQFSSLFQDNAFIATFLAAFTPFPDKIYNIVAGLFKLNPLIFVLGLLTGRGLRFFIVAMLAAFLGQKFSRSIHRYLNHFSWLVLAVVIIVLAFLL